MAGSSKKNNNKEIEIKKSLSIIDTYLGKSDWKVKENSNMGYSLQGLNNYISSEISKDYWLHKIYDKHIREAHEKAEMHLHDLGSLSTYTYLGKEVVIAKLNGKILNIGFDQLYEIVDIPEMLLNKEDDAWVKRPQNLEVLDKDGWVKVRRLIRKKKNRPMQFIKNMNGRSVIVTDNHPMITQSGEKEAVSLEKDVDKLYNVDIKDLLKDEDLFSVDEIDLLKELKDRGITEFNGEKILYSKYNFQVGKPIDNVNDSDLNNRYGFICCKNDQLNRFIYLDKKIGKEVMNGILGDLDHNNKDKLGYMILEKIFNKEKRTSLPFNHLQCSKEFNKGIFEALLEKNKGSFTELEITMSSRTQMEQLHILYSILGKELAKEFKNNNLNYLLDGTGSWSGILENIEVSIKDDYIYDITTETGTLVVNGMYNHNCCGWDLWDLLEQGFGGVAEKIESGPPAHFSSALGQINNFIFTLQGECYSDDTEVLTDQGWKLFKGLNKTEKFATLNTHSDKIEYQEAVNYFDQYREEDLIHFKNNGVDLLVTKGHNILLKHDNGDYHFVKSNDILIDGSDIKHHSIRRYYDFGSIVDDINISKDDIKLVPYKGHVYCVEVPNHTLIVRRGGVANICGNCAGAQAFSSFDTLMAPFVRRDKLTYSQIHQHMQEFVFNLNVPTRSGAQSPFSNLSFDLTVSPNYSEMPIIIKGKTDWYLDEHDKIVKKEDGGIKPALYKYFQKEMDLINKAFCEVMMEGDYRGRILTFPIPTYSITKEFDWDNPKMKPLFEMTSKYGICYFSNFINSDMKPEDARSMCCAIGGTEIPIMIGDKYVDVKLVDLPEGVFKVKNKYGDWINAIKVKIPYSEEFYKLTLKYGGEVAFTEDHINLLNNGVEKFSRNLEVGDKLYEHNLMGDTIEKIEKIENNDGFAYCVEIVEEGEEPYFTLSNGIVTHNCRLRLDSRELRKRGGGMFGANPSTGSISVSTLNLPRIGYKFKNDEKGYLKEVDRLLHIARRTMLRKREALEKYTESGLYPYTKHYLKKVKKSRGGYWSNHFSTIGILGMHESSLNMFGEGIESEKGRSFAVKVLNYIRDRIIKFQEEDGCLYNLEATPGEGTTFRFAKKDREEFGKDIIISGKSRSYYTGATSLPVDYNGDIFDILEHQNNLLPLYTGGSTIHLYLGERIQNIDVCKKLVKRIAENFEIPYFTLSPVFSICPEHGYISGEHFKCPCEYGNE